MGVSVGLGEGGGEGFFRFGLGVSSSSGVGVGDDLCLRWTVDFGEAAGLGDGVGLLFLGFGRRLFGVGVGVAKNFMIFSPNDGSSA
jgi:hypothetical protein